MKPEELEQTLEAHAAWLKGTGGKRANFSRADLTRADLSGASLTRAYLAGASLTGADLRGASLSGANLSGADLTGANLSGANLTGADLRGVQLQEAVGIKWASVSFAGHGEKGRQLLVVEINNEPRWFCGCFQGSTAELRAYIEEGVERYRKSRTRTMEMALECLTL